MTIRRIAAVAQKSAFWCALAMLGATSAGMRKARSN